MAKQRNKAVKKARVISKEEISLKNRQAYLTKKKKIEQAIIQDIYADANYNIEAFAPEKDRKRKRKYKTIIAEHNKKIREINKELKKATKARVKITKGKYKPKQDNKYKKLGGEKKAKKGILTLGHYLQWEEPAAFNKVMIKRKHLGNNIVSFEEWNFEKDFEKAVADMQDLFQDMESNDIVIIKLDIESGNAFGERSKIKYKGTSSGKKYKPSK